LGKPYFLGYEGLGKYFLNKAYGWVNYFQYKPSIEQNMKILYLTKWVIPGNIHSFPPLITTTRNGRTAGTWKLGNII
jgi:hypothetical protein